MDTRRRTIHGDEPINPDFGEGRWQDALRRMRERIAAGLELDAWDCTAIGNKDTHCSWGMCSNDIEQWPDKDDHAWPVQFEERQRVAPRTPPGGCPLDTRTGTPEESRWGCFYHCRVFRYREIGYTGHRRSEDKNRGRKVALQLYDDVIAAREAEYGKKTTADDDEPLRTPDV